MSSPPCTNVKAPIDDFLATVLVSVNVPLGSVLLISHCGLQHQTI